MTRTTTSVTTEDIESEILALEHEIASLRLIREKSTYKLERLKSTYKLERCVREQERLARHLTYLLREEGAA